MNKTVKDILLGLCAVFLIVGYVYFFGDENVNINNPSENTLVENGDYIQLVFPEERYPETALHIKEAIERGHSNVCTIDRDGADENRKLSLKGIPTVKGKDRDEWPMAMCSEGGLGADIKHISPSDNRGAGSWVGNKLENYPDGTQIQFIFK